MSLILKRATCASAAVLLLLAVSCLQTCGQTLRTDMEIRPHSIPQVRPLYKHDTLSLLICGDLMMHSKQISHATTAKDSFDFSTYFRHIGKYISGADIAVGNMEFALGGQPYSGYPCFSAPDEFARYAAQSGFDIFLCANNHIFDKGRIGAERTLEKYRELREEFGIRFTGLCGSEEELAETIPLFVVVKGIRLALLNFTYGTNNNIGKGFPMTNRLDDNDLLEKAFRKACEADFVVALPHWGEEYMTSHSSAQRKAAVQMFEQGADVIIGSHPHVVQDTLQTAGGDIIYSLGNLVSNMSARDTQLGLMAHIRIVRYGNGDLKMQQPELIWTWCSRPGGYCNNFTVLPVEEFLGRRNEWAGPWDYDKMEATLERVSKATGIQPASKKHCKIEGQY